MYVQPNDTGKEEKTKKNQMLGRETPRFVWCPSTYRFVDKLLGYSWSHCSLRIILLSCFFFSPLSENENVFDLFYELNFIIIMN